MTRQVQCDSKLCCDSKVENHVRSVWCSWIELILLLTNVIVINVSIAFQHSMHSISSIRWSWYTDPLADWLTDRLTGCLQVVVAQHFPTHQFQNDLHTLYSPSHATWNGAMDSSEHSLFTGGATKSGLNIVNAFTLQLRHNEIPSTLP